MGLVFGKVSEEVPAHVVVHAADNYQIWRYPAQVAAVVRAADLPPSDSSNFTSRAFPILARYIGVFSTPENTSAAPAPPTDPRDPENIPMTAPVVVTPDPENIAMTAPVVVTPDPEKVAMTAPVVVTPDPQKVAMTAPVVVTPTRADALPADQSMAFLLPSKYTRVEDAPVPTNPAVKLRMLPDARCEAVLHFSGNFDMRAAATNAHRLLEMLDADRVTVIGHWNAQGYNPPFTLPWLKRNEIHVPVDPAPYANIQAPHH